MLAAYPRGSLEKPIDHKVNRRPACSALEVREDRVAELAAPVLDLGLVPQRCRIDAATGADFIDQSLGTIEPAFQVLFDERQLGPRVLCFLVALPGVVTDGLYFLTPGLVAAGCGSFAMLLSRSWTSLSRA